MPGKASQRAFPCTCDLRLPHQQLTCLDNCGYVVFGRSIRALFLPQILRPVALAVWKWRSSVPLSVGHSSRVPRPCIEFFSLLSCLFISFASCASFFLSRFQRLLFLSNWISLTVFLGIRYTFTAIRHCHLFVACSLLAALPGLSPSSFYYFYQLLRFSFANLSIPSLLSWTCCSFVSPFRPSRRLVRRLFFFFFAFFSPLQQFALHCPIIGQL